MNANDFTWKQRGAVDAMLGVSFDGCPVDAGPEAAQWQAGWLQQTREETDRDVRISNQSAKLVCEYVLKHSGLFLQAKP